MKRVSRSRKGFTLAEMVLVIAIIVILAGAAAVGVVEKINRANQNADAVRLHAAGGHFWTVEGGHVVELDPSDYDPSNPYHRSGGAMDMQYDEVKYIQGTVPQHAPQTYNPGGGDPIGPGNGGSGGNPVDPGNGGGANPGGDNPGGGAVNPVEPDDPMWNGHPESWWDKHDAEIEKKIQDAINKGVNPDDIKVTRDPETGHITDYVIPSAPGGSGNVTVSGHAVQAYQGNVGTISSSTSGNTTTLHITDTNGYNDLTIKIIDNGDGTYTTELGGAQYNLNNNGKIPKFPGYVDNQGTYTLDDAQKKWFTDNYGVNFG